MADLTPHLKPLQKALLETPYEDEIETIFHLLERLEKGSCYPLYDYYNGDAQKYLSDNSFDALGDVCRSLLGVSKEGASIESKVRETKDDEKIDLSVGKRKGKRSYSAKPITRKCRRMVAKGVHVRRCKIASSESDDESPPVAKVNGKRISSGFPVDTQGWDEDVVMYYKLNHSDVLAFQ